PCGGWGACYWGGMAGQAKQKQYSRAQFLLRHPRCAYCGGVATTTDHCPPRSFFLGRVWPETYEFPACGPCNAEGRGDEQILAVLVRVGLSDMTPLELDEWRK